MHSLVLIALLAWAQADAMTLSEVDAEALANNPEIRSLQQQARLAKRRLGSAAAVQLAEKGPKPDFSMSAGYMLMPSGSVNRNGYLAEFSITLPWLNRLSVIETQSMSIEADAIYEALSDCEQSLAYLERAIGMPLPGERKPL